MTFRPFAIALLCAATGLNLSAWAEPLPGQVPDRPIILNEDGSWGYADDIAGTGVAAFDESGRGVRLFESIDATTGDVTRSWKQTEAVLGRIDVAISRVVESSANASGTRVSCIPVYTIRNLSGVRLDRLLLGIDYHENDKKIGGFSFMVGPLDDGEKQDLGAPDFDVSDCNRVRADVHVVACRVTLDRNCLAAVRTSEHSAVPLALVSVKP
jgi:hypothetical protein